MKKALHIISSARGDQSYSKGLSTAIVNRLLERKKIDTVIERNLINEFPPLLDEKTMQEFYKHPATYTTEGMELLKYADSIFQEIKDVDIIVIGTPMHNLGMSAPLKAWIDQLVRFGVTYSYGENGQRVGHVTDKTVYLAIASGGQMAFWPEGYEFIESYIQAVLSAYIGITDVRTYRVEGTAFGDFKPDYQAIIQTL